MTKQETISHAVYDGRELAGTVAKDAAGLAVFDAAGKRLGAFQTRIEAVKAVLAAPRTDAEPLAETDAAQRGSGQTIIHNVSTVERHLENR